MDICIQSLSKSVCPDVQLTFLHSHRIHCSTPFPVVLYSQFSFIPNDTVSHLCFIIPLFPCSSHSRLLASVVLNSVHRISSIYPSPCSGSSLFVFISSPCMSRSRWDYTCFAVYFSSLVVLAFASSCYPNVQNLFSAAFAITHPMGPRLSIAP